LMLISVGMSDLLFCLRDLMFCLWLGGCPWAGCKAWRRL